ncbi:hypothetical protein COJ88_29470 [Bacillus cereus]|uniref:hypothetical protein n=1 Tax=Bacillus cereus TaxID=1396 RepID=UPI000BF6D6A4|nr:hypothetical protein [Bacillus cereus]PFO84576.1 hypothetical protein COJ88_29470 [Bacillus cereus]PGL48988.1 hypothetical protein CN922_19510 [Bacillus cereus]
MTNINNQQEYLDFIAQEIEGGRNTRASISNQLSWLSNDPVEMQISNAIGTLGPWDTGSITFGNGVAVGGYANLTLHQDGSFNFSGHFHDSGGISYDTSFVWAVRDSNVPATIYVFAHNGRVHGTFESGSRDDNWGVSGTNPALHAGWSALERGGSWHWEARVNADFGVFLDDIIKLVAAGSPIGNVVKLIV